MRWDLKVGEVGGQGRGEGRKGGMGGERGGMGGEGRSDALECFRVFRFRFRVFFVLRFVFRFRSDPIIIPAQGASPHRPSALPPGQYS